MSLHQYLHSVETTKCAVADDDAAHVPLQDSRHGAGPWESRMWTHLSSPPKTKEKGMRRGRPGNDISQIEVLSAQQLIGYAWLTSTRFSQRRASDLTFDLVFNNGVDRKGAFDT